MRFLLVFVVVAATLLATSDAVSDAAIASTSVAANTADRVGDTQRFLRASKEAQEDEGNDDEEERAIPWMAQVTKFVKNLQTERHVSKSVTKYLEGRMTPTMLFKHLKLASLPRTDVKWRIYSKFVTEFKKLHPGRYSSGFKVQPRLTAG